MISAIVKNLKYLFKNDKGGVLILVSLVMLPMLLMLGLAVDSSYGLAEKRRLQMACDAAAKAGAANGNGITATITSEAQKLFTANTANMTGITGPTISVNSTANTITVSASITVNNSFMTLGGIPTSTYSASTTWALPSTTNAEVAIVYEVSARFLNSNFHQNICNSLISFVNSLPNNVMVSITPIATEVLFNAANTNPNNLFTLLSSTTNDESANPGLFPLASSYSWTSGNYGSVVNIFYTNGYYATYPTDPNVLMSFPSPGTCTIPNPTYASCSPITWPTKCPVTNKTSCSQVYSYNSNTAYPILPLTLNRSVITSYLNNLAAFATSADGVFPSLISWGWRTIDPNWNNFWQTNSSLTSALYTTGTYPKPYGGVQKSIIIILNNTAYWNQYSGNVSALYSNTCGNAATVVNGLNHWWVTAYGMVPVPTDYQSYVDDITCENRWYNTIDNTLGLNLTATPGYYNATVNSSTYSTDVLNAVNAKFFRICKNIKAKNVNIYLMAANNTGTLSPCCNSSSNAYTIGNSGTSISAALSAISTKIVAIVN